MLARAWDSLPLHKMGARKTGPGASNWYYIALSAPFHCKSQAKEGEQKGATPLLPGSQAGCHMGARAHVEEPRQGGTLGQWGSLHRSLHATGNHKAVGDSSRGVPAATAANSWSAGAPARLLLVQQHRFTQPSASACHCLITPRHPASLSPASVPAAAQQHMLPHFAAATRPDRRCCTAPAQRRARLWPCASTSQLGILCVAPCT